MTKDERFLLQAYLTRVKGELDSEWVALEIAVEVGFSERTTLAICRQLVRGNFIEKSEEGVYFLTPHGISVAESLLEEQGE